MTPPVPITLVLPDGQMIGRVRLYERQQLDSGLWMYRVGAPLWQTALGGDVEPVEYETWVTSAELRPIPGVDMSAVPTIRRASPPPPARWAWVLARREAGSAVMVHAAGCRLAAGHGREVGTEAALDALARPGAVACTGCDAAEVLVPILEHGQDQGSVPAGDGYV
ncbi:DUF6233 domain-containing protein [Streptomyces sp. NPDC006704]|uniref:DUF6233 domain-containing protein n=1 Tax=Streptomyces sp. NPDC006704 TaxID=3364760 RepID=UPI0036A7FFC3